MSQAYLDLVPVFFFLGQLSKVYAEVLGTPVEVHCDSTYQHR